MAGERNHEGTKKLFISYKIGDERSIEIINHLQAFFSSWGIECYVAELAEDTRSPEGSILENLQASQYLIQILNNQGRPSRWMREEWDIATVLQRTKNGIQAIYAFYTSETPINTRPYRTYLNFRKEGKHRIVNIDKDKRELQAIFKSILIDANALNKKHGEIILPEFCYSPRPPADINLKLFEDFLDNFKHAYNKGLTKIFPDKDSSTEWLSQRMSNMKKGEKVRMLGFTLFRYVYPNSDRRIGNIFEEKILKDNCTAELLIIDRACKAAHERMKIETPTEYKKNNPNSALLYKDNGKVIRKFSLKKWNGKISLKKYKSPYVGLVLFNDMILVEIYHLGDDGEHRTNKNICGRVPILLIRSGTSFYKLFDSHFTNVWKIASKIRY
jgi:hypothetical protein